MLLSALVREAFAVGNGDSWDSSPMKMLKLNEYQVLILKQDNYTTPSKYQEKRQEKRQKKM